MPMLVRAGSISRQATSPSASRRSRASRSLNGTTAVVAATSTCGPRAPGRGDDPVAVQDGEGLVDGAVVAPVHHRDPGAPGEVPGEAQHEPVGVGGRHRELPGGQPEPAGQLLAHPGGVRRGQHRGQPAGRLAGDGLGDLGERVPGHGAGVAQAQVDVLETVDVGQPRAGGVVDEERERPGPPGHPRHRHPGQERAVGLRGELGGAGVQLGEAGLLGGTELGETLTVDHARQSRAARPAPARVAGNRCTRMDG